MKFDKKLLQEARQMFYRVYVDKLNADKTAYEGSTTATDPTGQSRLVAAIHRRLSTTQRMDPHLRQVQACIHLDIIPIHLVPITILSLYLQDRR